MANVNAIREAMQAVVDAVASTQPKHAKVTRKVTMQPKGIYECPKCNNKVQVHLPVLAVECIRHNDGPTTMTRRSK